MATYEEQMRARMQAIRSQRPSSRRNLFGDLGKGLRSIAPTISSATDKMESALTPTSSGITQRTGKIVDVGPQAIRRFQDQENQQVRASLPSQLQAWTDYDRQKEAYDNAVRERKQVSSQDGFISSGPLDDEGRPIDPNFGVPQEPLKPNLPAKSQLLSQALDLGVDLRPFYGEGYADAVKFKKDLGQYSGKDESMIIPANPVGYGGQFKFDPNFGSAFYRDLATQSGKALGLSDEQILQKGTEYFKDKFASGAKTAGVIGFTDFGTGLIDSLATTAGVPAERLGELKGTALKPLYDANQQVFSGLNNAARIESQSSGFFKGIGQDIAKLGPIGTIALGAALGPAGLGFGAATAGAAAGALPGLLQGDLSSALKGGAIGGIGGGALGNLGNLQGSISDALGGGAIGNIAGGAAKGALQGGVGSLLAGGDIGKGLLTGGLFGGGASAAGELIGQTGSALDQAKRSNQEFFGLNPNAKSPTIDFGNPQNFGPTFDLPNTIGALVGAPSIGGLFDDMEFPGMGLDPNATGLLNLGSGIGQGLTNPTSPTLSGQLGQGLTVGVPGGTLGQGGVTPTGQITLGNPNSFINGGQGSSPSFDVSKLLKGLLGAGTAAAIGSSLGGSNNNQQQTQQALPVQRFSMNPQMFNYTGDPAKYGETDIGNFQFYKPNIGLLG